MGHLLVRRRKKTFLNGKCATIWLQVGFLSRFQPIEIRPSILYAKIAVQIWSDLKDRFSQSNAPKIYQLKQSISALKQEGMFDSLYFTQLKLYCSCQSMYLW
jgi:hypothetical protein